MPRTQWFNRSRRGHRRPIPMLGRTSSIFLHRRFIIQLQKPDLDPGHKMTVTDHFFMAEAIPIDEEGVPFCKWIAEPQNPKTPPVKFYDPQNSFIFCQSSHFEFDRLYVVFRVQFESVVRVLHEYGADVSVALVNVD